MNKIVICLMLASTLLISCNNSVDKSSNVEILDIVWNTMDTLYFDSTFGGLNWQEQYDYYKPIIKACETDDSLYYHLNKMLFQLEVSHLGVVSKEESEMIGDPQLFLDGTLGIDVRYLNGEAVIVSVQPNSLAAELGIIQGFLITELNGKTIDEIVKERKLAPTPPFNDRNLASMITQDIIRELYGTPGDTVSIGYIGYGDNEQSISIQLKERRIEKTSLHPDIPEIYARLDNSIINNEIGYIRFDVFHPILLDSLISVISDYNNLPNIMLDIRGNPGGEFNTRRTLAEQFVADTTLFWKYKYRNDLNEVYLNPTKTPYTGNLVIMVDELSGSSSEEFAGAMQAIGRATIIGKQTPGKVLTMEVVPLPEGALFVYPNSQTITSKNEVLEGVGVIPDIIIELNKEALLNGVDSQLEKAVEYLTQRKRYETKH